MDLADIKDVLKIRTPHITEYKFNEISSLSDRFEIKEIIPKVLMSMKKKDSDEPAIYVGNLNFQFGDKDLSFVKSNSIVWAFPDKNMPSISGINFGLKDEFGSKEITEALDLTNITLPQNLSVDSITEKFQEFQKTIKDKLEGN